MLSQLQSTTTINAPTHVLMAAVCAQTAAASVPRASAERGVRFVASSSQIVLAVRPLCCPLLFLMKCMAGGTLNANTCSCDCAPGRSGLKCENALATLNHNEWCPNSDPLFVAWNLPSSTGRSIFFALGIVSSCFCFFGFSFCQLVNSRFENTTARADFCGPVSAWHSVASNFGNGPLARLRNVAAARRSGSSRAPRGGCCCSLGILFRSRVQSFFRHLQLC